MFSLANFIESHSCITWVDLNSEYLLGELCSEYINARSESGINLLGYIFKNKASK